MSTLFVSYIFSLAQQPSSVLGRLVFEVPKSNTIRNTRSVGLLRTSDQLLAEHTTNIRRTTMPSAGFETSILAVEQPQPYVLDYMAAAIDSVY
jgi:hypothetical protein